MSEIKGYLLTTEEEEVCLKFIKENRAKKAHEEEVKYYKKKIENLITEMIEDIGLGDTKHVIREIKRKVEEIKITGNGIIRGALN